MKNLYFAALLLVSSCCSTQTEHKIVVDPAIPQAEYYAYVVADCGRNGSFDQTKIGEVMGIYSETIEPEFVLQCGDMFHYNGVQSVNDPLFMTNFEQIYHHGELQCSWWGVLGNHEYHGNTQAVMDYQNVSRRWNMPSQYYAKMFEGADKEGKDSVLVLFTDTAPMIDKYHEESDYPDARLQDPDKQIAWIDSTLAASNAKWKITIGHHPVYSYSKKSPKETAQMQERVAGIYKKHGVDMNFSGHVHTFQHLQPTDAVTDYFVTPSGSLGRAAKNGEFTTFADGSTGFIILGFNEDHISVNVINAEGKMIYTYNVEPNKK